MSLNAKTSKLQRKAYRRYLVINQRCYVAKSKDYKHYGARGVKVDWIWHRDNPDGQTNFITWFEQQIKIVRDASRDNIMLRDKTKNYSPDNCQLATCQEFIQNGEASVISRTQVILARKLKHENPKITYQEIAQRLEIQSTIAALCKAVRGDTFANLNEISPPYDKKQFQTNEL